MNTGLFSDTRRVVETGLLTGLSIVIAFLGVTLPAFNFLNAFLVPAIMALVCIRHGMRYGILSAATSFVVMFLFQGPAGAGIVLLSSALGLGVGACYIKKLSDFLRVIVPAVAYAVALGIVASLMAYISHVSIMGLYDQMFNNSAAVGKELGLNQAQMDSMIALTESFKQLFVGLIFSSALILSLGVTKVTEWLGNRVGMTVRKMSPFHEFRLNAYYVAILAVSAIVMTLGPRVGLPVEAHLVFYNIAFFLTFIFEVAGIAFVLDVVYSYGYARKSMALSALIVVACLFVSNFVMIVGIIDALFPVRKYYRSKRAAAANYDEQNR